MTLPHNSSHPNQDSDRVRLLVPIIVLILAATAVPVELRRFDFATLRLGWNLRDLVENVILYFPVGVVLASLGFWRALMIATFLSLFAETCQIFMVHRFPSPFDLAMNVAGTMTGLLIARRSQIHVPAIRVNVWTAWLSMLAALTILGFRARSDWEDLSVNCRGATLPGSVEAHWTFDEMVTGVFFDSSGNGLDGALIGRTVPAEGIHGMAVRVDGENAYVNFGHPVQLRLMGSMTICTWINSTSFPVDDAAIISTKPGYQLDTTVDKGPRTIGFKLSDPCGNDMIRYGATELVLDTWYHVAGVYDADARTLHVYLNGHPDDGFLSGPVAHVQKTSGHPVCLGRRPDFAGSGFSGLIDDVRIYSRALSEAEIEKAMNCVEIGNGPLGRAAHTLASEIMQERLAGHSDRCHQPTRAEDAFVPVLMVAVGMLSALACTGFWPGHRLFILGISLAVGLLLYPAAAVTLPPYVLWMIPLLSLMGGASVAVSLIRASQRP